MVAANTSRLLKKESYSSLRSIVSRQRNADLRLRLLERLASNSFWTACNPRSHQPASL